MKTKLFFLFTALISIQAQAISLDWTGGYRIEYNEVDRTSLATNKDRKSYGLNYLYLQPRILASDGITVVSRFELFANELPAYRNSQLGSFIGGGLKNTTSGNTGANVTAENSDSPALRVSQLYLNVNQEYGSFVAGRAPIEFGMGITHNAGRGTFDHWIDTKDMVGYKFMVDNMSFMPILARVYQKDFGQGVTINDQIYVLEYDNKDVGAKAGVFHQTRKTSPESNDSLSAPVGYPGAASLVGGLSAQTINVFLERKWTSFEFRLEASFLTGATGVQTAALEEIKLNSYAVAGEMLFPAVDASKWEFGGKFGVVSGDDPSTTTYEGYQLDRNYDVAHLLFNHRLGQRDFLTTGVLHSTDGAPNNLNTGNSADDEAIGNAAYISPRLKYMWDEKFDLKSSLTYAQLMTNPGNFVDFKKDLGLEWDMSVVYKPRERVTWETGFGILFPGQAWTAGSLDLDSKWTYGISTKAAITF